MVVRPCYCERYRVGRLYEAGFDCAECWVFAHRPEIRAAWGGNPDECVDLYAARPHTPVRVLAEILTGPIAHLPDGWRLWSNTRDAHLLLADRFIAEMPAYPADRYRGRGAILCGGGRYEASAYVTCRMLRLVGWQHPIQVWHRGVKEPVSRRLRQLPGVEVVDAEDHPARPSRRVLGGWEAKMFAILHCPFEEVLFLDADCYPVTNPDTCFEPANNPHGIVTWPDMAMADLAPQWASYGLEADDALSLNGGQYVLDKRKAWPVLNLAAHFDNHSDYYYCHTSQCVGDVGGFGDQDQFRVALHKLRFPSRRYTERPLLCDAGAYVQAGPSGQPMFVHRHHSKFASIERFYLPPRWEPKLLPMEATAWRFFLDWELAPEATAEFPEDVPGWFTRAEMELWGRVCRDRHVLELGRHHGRSTVVAAKAARAVVSLDRDAGWPADAWLQRYGVRHKVWLREGEFAHLVPSSGGPFSACLVDGAHDRGNVVNDIEAVVSHLEAGAMIGFHDYADPMHPDVQPTVDAAAQRHGWQLAARADYLAVFKTSGFTRVET